MSNTDTKKIRSLPKLVGIFCCSMLLALNVVIFGYIVLRASMITFGSYAVQPSNSMILLQFLSILLVITSLIFHLKYDYFYKRWTFYLGLIIGIINGFLYGIRIHSISSFYDPNLYWLTGLLLSLISTVLGFIILSGVLKRNKK